MKTLFFDLETSAMVARVWGAYDQNIIKEVTPSKILCVGYKWEHQKKAHVVSLPDFPGYTAGVVDDREITQFLWELMNEADVVVAHNGRSFDVKIAYTRMQAFHMKPPRFPRVIDTKNFAKKTFRFAQNKLNYISPFLGGSEKVEHEGFPLWEKCEQGDMAAWRRMEKYCRHDVKILEEIYLHMRPWMGPAELPNSNVYDDTVLCCTACKSNHLQRRGSFPTRTGRRAKYQCQDCGHWESGKIVPYATLVR